jgi:hypothetical protein
MRQFGAKPWGRGLVVLLASYWPVGKLINFSAKPLVHFKNVVQGKGSNGTFSEILLAIY